MALKAVLDSLDSVPEAHRELYKKHDDGKFRLDAEGVEFEENVRGLKSALEKERDEKKTASQKYKELQEQLGDLDPAKAREALKKLQEIEDKKLIDSGKIDEVVAQRMERARQDFETQAKAFNSKIETVTKERDTLASRLSELVIDGALRDAAIKAGVKTEAIDDAIIWGKQVYRMKDGAPIPMDGETILYGKDPNKPLPMEEWLQSQMTKKPHWFAESAGAGATTTKTNGKISPKNLKRSAMSTGDKSKFVSEYGMDAYLALPA
jgi:hypothetical protein